MHDSNEKSIGVIQCSFLRQFYKQWVANFTQLWFPLYEVKSMRMLWKWCNRLHQKGMRRIGFYLINMFVAGLCGLILWVMLQGREISSASALACFVLSPVIIYGLWGTTIFLMNHEKE